MSDDAAMTIRELARAMKVCTASTGRGHRYRRKRYPAGHGALVGQEGLVSAAVLADDQQGDGGQGEGTDNG